MSKYITYCLLVLIVFSISFNTNKIEKKIDKIAQKLWVNTTLSKSQISIKDSAGISVGNVYKLENNAITLGYACYTSAFGCRIGGCAKPTDPNLQTYESFDYLVIYDSVFKILNVEIVEYPGAYGYQICKPSWLKQFNGKSHNIQLNKDIDGISGATISAQFLIDDLNTLYKIFNNYLVSK